MNNSQHKKTNQPAQGRRAEKPSARRLLALKSYRFLLKHKERLLALALVLVIGGGVFFGYSALQARRAEAAYAAGDYENAVQRLNAAPWLRGTKPYFYGYARARALMDAGRYEESLACLRELQRLGEEPELALDGLYRLAGSLVEAGERRQALALLTELGQYRDSRQLCENIRLYESAVAQTEMAARYIAFQRLGDFLDSEQQAETAAAPLYSAALTSFEEGLFWEALTGFAQIPGHAQADTYRQACELWNSAAPQADQNRELFGQLQLLAEGVNLGKMLLSNEFLPLFLEGSWHSVDGGGFFVGAERYSFTSIELPGRDYYFAQEGMVSSAGEAPVVQFAYLSYNEITVTVAATGQTHHFTRD